jgi:hypothetical protein
MINQMDKVRIKAERERRNQEIAEAIKRGDYIEPRMDVMEVWYPRHPPIKKEKNALQILFDKSEK